VGTVMTGPLASRFSSSSYWDYIVADDLQIVKLNGHRQLSSFGAPRACVLTEPALSALDTRPKWLREPLFSQLRSGLTSFSV